ncbi:MAG: cupin domain-containing protein [Jiangellaceae bacterium]
MTTFELAADRVLVQDANAAAVEHAPVDTEDVLGGRPTMGTLPLSDEAGVELGVWEITSGIVTDIEADEVFVVLSGRGRLEFDDGTSTALAAGIVVRLRAGDRTRWIVYETLRKIYVLLPHREESTP